MQPINWVLFVLLWSLLTKNLKRRKRLLWLACIMMLFFTNRMILNNAMHWWEVETITADQIQQPYDLGILLGGYSNSNIRPNHDRFNISLHGNRFLNALELYHAGKVKKLLLSGGSGSLLQNKPKEAERAAELLRKMGLPDSVIIVENKSRNTYENAVYSAKLIRQLPGNPRCLLLTSAFHMRRAAACFEKAGVQFTPFSVDHFYLKPDWAPKYWLIPDPLGFYYWEILVKEWLGCLAYRIKGYI